MLPILGLLGVYLPPTHWAYDALASLASEGLIKGAPAWLFKDLRFLHLPSTHLERDPTTGYRTWNHASRLTDRRLLTRARAAELIAEALEAFQGRPRKASHRERSLLWALCQELEEELAERGMRRCWWEQVLGRPQVAWGAQASLNSLRVGSPGKDAFDLSGRLYALASEGRGERRTFAIGALDFGVGRGRRGEFEQGCLLLRHDGLWKGRKIGAELSLGRLWWGPGSRSSLLLGGFLPPRRLFFGLSYGFRALGRRIDFQATASGLGGGRYFLAHRLEWSPSPPLSVGLSEGFVKEGFPGPFMWLATSLPFPLTGVSALGDEKGNAIVSFDVAYDEGKGFGAWGELLLDDLIWRKGETGENEFGLLLGMRFYDRKRPLRNFLLVEYARSDRFTYHEARPQEEPRIGNEWLGHWLGPDAQNFFIHASHEVASNLTLSVAIEYTDYELSLSSPEQIRRREQVRTLEAVYNLRPQLALRLVYQDLSRYGVTTPAQSESRLSLAVEGYF